VRRAAAARGCIQGEVNDSIDQRRASGSIDHS
jgi:hypothetical protein